MNTLREDTTELLKNDIPDFNPGDTVSVDFRVVEGGKERIQRFKGVVIGRKGGGIEETFTVWKISRGRSRKNISSALSTDCLHYS